MLTCKAAGVYNPTGGSVTWNFGNEPFTCGTFAGPTNDWSETVSTKGNATLSCHVAAP